MLRYDLNFIALGIREHSNIIPKNIFEISSRDGHDAFHLAKTFGLTENDCYVFEPNPEAAEFIMKTYPGFHLFNNAVSDVAGNLEFTIEAENIGASSLRERTEPKKDTKTVQVECVRMDEVIESLDIKTIDVAKIDVEGVTLQVLQSFGKHLDKLQSIQLEMEHKECWKGQSLYPEIKTWLEANGYVEILFCLMRGIQSDSFWLKKDRMII